MIRRAASGLSWLCQHKRHHQTTSKPYQHQRSCLHTTHKEDRSSCGTLWSGHDKSIELHESRSVQASQTGSVLRHKRFEMNPFSQTFHFS